MSSPQPYLCVYASQLAACIGQNRHKKPCEAAEQLWERADPASYAEALRRNGLSTDEEQLREALARYPEVDTMLRAAGEATDTSQGAADKYTTLSATFDGFAQANDLGADEIRVVDEALRKTSYTSFGTARESGVFRHICTSLGWDCVQDPTFYRVQAGVVRTARGEHPWFIGGKIDGVGSDRSYLIEIKCRVNRLFHRVPAYEVVQIQTYMEVLNIDKGILVECMFSQDKCLDLSVVQVARDRALWKDDFFPKLERFVAFVADLLYDPALQDKFLQSKRRNSVIASHKPRAHTT